MLVIFPLRKLGALALGARISPYKNYAVFKFRLIKPLKCSFFLLLFFNFYFQDLTAVIKTADQANAMGKLKLFALRTRD